MVGEFGVSRGAAAEHRAPVSSWAAGGAADGGDAESPGVLIVDDESVNRRVLANYLGSFGCRIEECRDGFRALERLGLAGNAGQGGAFQLVILDWMMPRMSGLEVCRRIRERYSLYALPVIMMTAQSQASGVLEGLEAGANEFLVKPVVQKEMRFRVQRLLEMSRHCRKAEEG